jgi:hypothetical protein
VTVVLTLRTVESVVADIERWFEARGLPDFVVNKPPARAVWSRALPLLIVAYLLGSFNALDLARWSWTRNVLVLGAGVALLVVVWVLSNRLRGQRAFSVPRAVGPAELVLFVLAPSVPSIVFGRQWGSAIASVLEGLAVLAVLYLAASFGVVAIVRWAGSRLRSFLPTFGNVLVRALPLLLLAMIVLFLTTEVWQFIAPRQGPSYWVVLGAMFVLGAIVLITRLPGDIASVDTFESWAELRECSGDCPIDHLALPHDGNPIEPPLRRREWMNVALVMLFSQAMQITLVAGSMFTVLVGFGFVAMHTNTQAIWLGDLTSVNELFHLTVGGERWSITEPLLRVAGFLAMFSGFYFTVYLVNDETYRNQFRIDMGGEIRAAMAVRIAYKHLLGS